MQLRGFLGRYHRRSNNAGFTMAEAVIAVGILGVMVYTGLGMWRNVANLKTKLNIESDRIDIGLALRDRIDCDKTIAAFSPSTVCETATVTSPVPVALRDATNQVIVASNSYSSTPVTSSYQAKATCYQDGSYYVFNATILASSQPTPDIDVYATKTKHFGYLCLKPPASSTTTTTVPPTTTTTLPPSPPGCFAMGDTGPDPACAPPCPNAYKSCYYNGSSTASFRLYGSDCNNLHCPGTPTKILCAWALCPME